MMLDISEKEHFKREESVSQAQLKQWSWRMRAEYDHLLSSDIYKSPFSKGINVSKELSSQKMWIMDCFTDFTEMPILNSHGAKQSEMLKCFCANKGRALYYNLTNQDARRINNSYE